MDNEAANLLPPEEVPEREQTPTPELDVTLIGDPVIYARERWEIDLNDSQTVLNKLRELNGKMPDVADLSNLYRLHHDGTL